MSLNGERIVAESRQLKPSTDKNTVAHSFEGLCNALRFFLLVTARHFARRAD